MFIIHHSGEFFVLETREELISNLASLCRHYDFYGSNSSDVFSIVRNWDEFVAMAKDGWQVNRVTSRANLITPHFLIQFNGGDAEDNEKILADVEIEVIRQNQKEEAQKIEKARLEAELKDKELEENERAEYERLRAKYAPTASE